MRIPLITFILSAALVSAMDKEALERFDEASIGISVVSLTLGEATVALGAVPVLGQALMLIDVVVAFANLVAHAINTPVPENPAKCNCICDNIVAHYARDYGGGFAAMGNTQKPTGYTVFVNGKDTGQTREQCQSGLIDKEIAKFQSTKSQIQRIGQQMGQINTQSATKFKNNVALIKKTMSTQQLVQPYYTSKLNLGEQYKQAFAQIREQEKWVKENTQYGTSVTEMVKSLDEMINNANQAKTQLGNNGKTVETIIKVRTKDSDTLLKSARKAFFNVVLLQKRINERIELVKGNLKKIDNQIATAKETGTRTQSANGDKQSAQLLAIYQPSDYARLALKLALVDTVSKRTGSVQKADEQVFGKENAAMIRSQINNLQTKNANRALTAIKKTKALDTTSQQQLKSAFNGLQQNYGQPSPAMKAATFNVVFGISKGNTVMQQSKFVL